MRLHCPHAHRGRERRSQPDRPPPQPLEAVGPTASGATARRRFRQDGERDALAATETAAWLGAAAFTKDATFAARCVTRDEYRANPTIIDTRFP